MVFDKLTRVEIIDYTKRIEEGGGRTVLVSPNSLDDVKVQISIQDNNKTLKIFIS